MQSATMLCVWGGGLIYMLTGVNWQLEVLFVCLRYFLFLQTTQLSVLFSQQMVSTVTVFFVLG